MTAGVLENASIVIEDGKIKEVGTRVNAPAGAEEHQAKVVIPGMIDAHAHIALRRMGAGSGGGPVTAEWKAVDNLDPADPMIPIAVSGGLTSVITRSGSGIVSSGQSVAIKFRGPGRGLTIVKPYVDLKMAVRPLINLRPGVPPATVMGWYAVASEHFRRASAYLRAQADHADGKLPRAPLRDERLEAFAAVLRGDVMVHVHSHYPSELTTVMDLAREFGFIDRLAFGHASESYPIADVIAKTSGGKAVPVVGPVFIVKFSDEDRSHNIIKELMDAGLPASVQTDKGQEQLRSFREYGAMLIRHGLTEQRALEALTINGAKAMMLTERLGSIAPGKDADLVLMDGPPFDLFAERVVKVFVDGVVEYERKTVLQPTAPTMVGPFKTMSGTLTADDRSYALTNATLFTITRGVVANGALVVENGKIVAADAGVAIPKTLKTIDLGGRVVLPGWVSARAFPNEWVGDLKFQVQNDEVPRADHAGDARALRHRPVVPVVPSAPRNRHHVAEHHAGTRQSGRRQRRVHQDTRDGSQRDGS